MRCLLTVSIDIVHPENKLDFLLVACRVTESCQELRKVKEVDRLEQTNLQQQQQQQQRNTSST
jgi:hypothetical protein